MASKKLLFLCTAVVLVLSLLLTGCGGLVSTPGDPGTSSVQSDIQDSAPESEGGSAPSQPSEAMPTKGSDSDTTETKHQLPEKDGDNASQSPEKDGETSQSPEDEDGDASQPPITKVEPADMLTISKESSQSTYIFRQLPQNAAEMEALWALHPSSSRNTAALFVAAIQRYAESPDDCIAMLDVLRGPQPMSDTEKAFLREQLDAKPHLPGSYFEGSSVANDYAPAEPYTIIVRDEAVSPPDGYGYAQLTSTGADNPRRLVTRIKDGSYYLWEYNGLLMSIRLPASQDPWA